jgi:spermidine dehydrogenase
VFDVGGVPVDEHVDLVVVGAGISGLSAAWFYRWREPGASILIVDNHDDFGGHARRNEFLVDGRRLITYGGSETMETPNTSYSDVAKALLRALGVELEAFETAFDRELYPSLGLSRGVFFAREAFGVDALVTGDPMRMVADDVPPDRMNARPIEAFVGDFPISPQARAQLLRLFTSDRDPFAGRAMDEKLRTLRGMSYRDYLTTRWGLDDVATNTFQGRPHDFFAAGIDAISALDAFETGYPGFGGIGLPPPGVDREVPYIHHFPDGNASIARLLVRELVPGVAPGSTMRDVVTAPFDYARLDRAGSATRVRLASTVVHVENRDEGVDVVYARGDALRRVRASHAILAGYHMMIARMMPELPPAQRDALSRNVKAPLVYAKVAVRDWRPWVRLGVHEITNPMGFFSRTKLDYPVSLGDHVAPRSPDEPHVLHLVHVPAQPNGGSLAERYRAGREALLAMPYDALEERIRDELTRMLGPGGFAFDRDVAAITVNRWGHGYSFGGEPFEDPLVERVYERARARRGNVAIGNADAGWSAYANVAIDQAHRAVGELLDDA